MIRDDYVMRMVRQAAEAIARALELFDKGEIDAAERQADSALGQALGPRRDMYGLVDTPTLISMIGTAELVRAVARASWLAGELHLRRGRPKKARGSFLRAWELFQHAGVGPAEEAAPAPPDGELMARIAARLKS